MQREKQQPACGFTLIELLVVITIISLLAAILFPVFARARQKAREAACLSNLKQLGLATQQYLSDNDQTYFFNLGPRFSPSVTDDKLAHNDPLDPSSNRWDVSPLLPALLPYTNSTDIWRCPALPPVPLSTAGTPEENLNLAVANYQVNLYLAVNSISAGCPHPFTPVHDGDVLNPTRIKVFQDYYAGTGDLHEGGANYVCADGHAKWQAATAANSGLITAKWWTP